MVRLLWIAFRIGLVVGLAATVLFYLLLAGRLLGGYFFLRGGPIGMLLNLHDFLSLLLIIYWSLLVRRLRPVDNPLFPFVVFFLMAVVEPYVLLGERGPDLIRTQRFVTFYLCYPMALALLGAWLIVWGVRHRHAGFDRGR